MEAVVLPFLDLNIAMSGVFQAHLSRKDPLSPSTPTVLFDIGDDVLRSWWCAG